VVHPGAHNGRPAREDSGTHEEAAGPPASGEREDLLFSFSESAAAGSLSLSLSLSLFLSLSPSLWGGERERVGV